MFKLYCFCKSLILTSMLTKHFTKEQLQKMGPLSVHLSFSFSPSLSPTSLSASPAAFLLTLTMCAVNNWWSSLTQRVTGLRENVSPISLFIHKSIFKSSQSEGPPQPFFQVQGSMGMRQPDGACLTVHGSCCTWDHEWVNAACLADSRTEGGKGSLNEWEVGGREEEWQNDRVN